MHPRNLILSAVGCGAFLGIFAADAVNPVMKPPVEAQWRKDLRALAASHASYRYAEGRPEDLYPLDMTDQMAPMFTLEIASMAGPAFRARPVIDYGKPVAPEAAELLPAETLDQPDRPSAPPPAAAPPEPDSAESSPLPPEAYPGSASVEVLRAGSGSVTISG